MMIGKRRSARSLVLAHPICETRMAQSQPSCMCPRLAPAERRYKTNAARVVNRAELLPVLEEAIRKQSASHWIQVFEKAGVPCGPINDMAQVFAMEQTKARGMRFDSEHPSAASGTVPQVACPIKLAGEELPARPAPPTLGAHTDEVLRDVLGYNDERIGQLRAEKVIG